MTYEEKIALVPIWHKSVLSLDEAVAYSGLGRHTLISFANDPRCNFVMWSGRKRLYKRRKLDEFIDNASAIYGSFTYLYISQEKEIPLYL